MLINFSIKQSYSVIFIILIFWASIAYYTMNTLIDSQSYYAKLINLSGKQRMLSQKSAFLASKYTQGNQQSYLKELKNIIELFKKNHNYIIETLSVKAENIYFHKEKNIDKQVKDYIEFIEMFLSKPSYGLSETIYKKSQTLLPYLDNAVNLFQKESEEKTKKLQQRELFIFIGTILTILFEAHFFARPVIDTIKLKFKDFYEMLRKKDNLIDLQSKFFLNAHEGIVITDKHNKILNINPAFEKISGYSKNEILGQTPSILKSGEHNDDFYKKMWEDINTKGFYKGEVINKKKDGNNYIQHISIIVLKNEFGEITNYCALIWDLTNEKKQEKIISDQTKMSSMGEMIGNIAHQWRQPLSIITSSASGLQIMKEHELLNDEHFYKALNQIEANAQYLSKTIDTFKNFIKEKKEFKEVIIQDKINNALNIIDATIKNNHIKLESKIDKIEPLKIETVTGELEQVIINILNNAKDAIIENNIKDPVITLELKKSKDHVILTLKDNAGGIPDNIMPRIFEPYFTTKDENKGTGLGLHMSYKIITQSLRGRLYAENTDNGAVFYIELPLSQSKKQ